MAALKRIVAVLGAALVVGGVLAAITWAWNRSVSIHYEQRAERARLIRAVCYGEPIDEALARVPPQTLIDDLDRFGASSDSPAEFVGQERIAEDVSDYQWRLGPTTLLIRLRHTVGKGSSYVSHEIKNGS